TAPLGLSMGMAFPCGMRLVSREFSRETPWLWGLNGVGSVLASSLAIIIALMFGLTNLTLVAALVYLCLLPAIALLTRPLADAGEQPAVSGAAKVDASEQA
ncbi:MAG: hypothetical protein KC492_05880, partial [Myxococcales bacterium]|nr:hypothetical protein [Myxococcales bacterium]